MRLHRLFSSLILASVLITVGAGCGGGGSTTSAKRVELSVWRVFDDSDSFDAIIDSYRAQHPNVRVEYRKLRFEEYKDELIRAIAKGEGPDIFSVHNTWMGEFHDLLEPMPPTVTVGQLETRGTLRKETTLVTTERPTMSMKTLRQSYIEAVQDDVVWPYQPDPRLDPEDRIYGLPLAVDTLALYYNIDLLNAAGVAEAPSTWTEFRDAVLAITKYNSRGDISQSAAAIGTSDNIERSTDILSVLMMQNGTNMTDDRGRVAFHTIPEGTPDDAFPGLDAAEFYTDFANSVKDVYTWSDDFSNSFDAFANGQTAMFFGYSYHLPLLRAAAPKLNFAVASLPQLSNDGSVQSVNFANYWIEGVSKSSRYTDDAWNFLMYAADSDNVVSYLSEAQRPTALRSLINSQLDDDDLGVFAEQLLTAKTWYRGNDADAAEQGIKDFIDTILDGTDEPEAAIERAAAIVQQTY